MDEVAIRQWLEALDSISYYVLFRVDPKATHDELHAAFVAFAESFHPDGHLSRAAREREAIGCIYRRGTEAWRVLSDPGLRARYDVALANGIVRPDELVVEMDGRRSLAPPSVGGRLVDTVRSPGARPFLLRAEELFKKGDPKQAKLQLVMALHMDSGNAALEAFGKQLDEAILAKNAGDKKAWSPK